MPKRYNPRDHYFIKAKKQGFRARSVFKLEEIQDKFEIIRRGDKVLDLGAAPGSFLQIIAKYIGNNGEAIGIDLEKIEPFSEENIKTFVADILNPEEMDHLLNERKFNVITSDLAPKTSGIRDYDEGRSIELNEKVLEIAGKYLKRNGNLVLKIFRGEDFNLILNKVKQAFNKTSCFKPLSSRDRSREIYIIGQQKVR